VSLTGAAAAFALCGLVGVLATFAPELWADLFTRDPDVRAATIAYLHRLGPSYAFFGLGLSLAFAMQGAARVGVPVSASFLRPIIIALAVFVGLAPTLDAIFTVAAVMMVVYGCAVLAGFLLQPLGRKRA
jgi:Na+-driven multidrug efflux pump